MTHRVGVLGPVHVAGRDAGGTATRALIVALALSGSGRARSATALADELWGEDSPQNPRAALQTLVSRTRALGGADLIESVTGGYALGDGDTDLAEAKSLLRVADELLREAASLRERLKLLRARALLAAGSSAEAAATLEEITETRPPRRTRRSS